MNYDVWGSPSHSNTELAVYPRSNSSNQPLGELWDDAGIVDACGVYEGPGGIWDLWGLVRGGFLTTDGKPGPGIHYRYDTCSQAVGSLMISSHFST